ncbi:MAG: hypothetical protein JXJ04_04350 [Spirochaetales bacterium]|nr:hypothetical protein [Spirochaetales bacterium]
MVKKMVFFCLLCISTYISYGDGYLNFYNKVKDNNTTIRIEEIKMRIAEANYEKAVIQSTTEDERITAEMNHLNALSAFRTNMSAFHTTLFSLIRDIVVKGIEYDILVMETRIAFLDYQYLKSLGNLVNSINMDVNEAFITYKENELDLRQAEWAKEEAFTQFSDYTGFQWDETYLDLLKMYPYQPVKESEWVKQDTDSELSRLKSELAGYYLKDLPANAAKFDVNIKKMEYDKALFEYEKTKTDSSAGLRRISGDLEFSVSTLLLLDENIKSYEKEIADARARFNKKLIPEKELLQKRVYAALLRKNYYNTLQKYISSVITLLMKTAKNPEEVLK